MTPPGPRWGPQDPVSKCLLGHSGAGVIDCLIEAALPLLRPLLLLGRCTERGGGGGSERVNAYKPL